jgi:hypothetical protein
MVEESIKNMTNDNNFQSGANTWPIVPRNQYQHGGNNVWRPQSRPQSRRNSWNHGSERAQYSQYEDRRIIQPEPPNIQVNYTTQDENPDF